MCVWMILLKNDFFGFPKVKWLQYTDEVGKCKSYWCQIISGFNTQKSLKLVNFWQIYLKNKRWTFFGRHSVVIEISLRPTSSIWCCHCIYSSARSCIWRMVCHSKRSFYTLFDVKTTTCQQSSTEPWRGGMTNHCQQMQITIKHSMLLTESRSLTILFTK